MNSDFDKTGWQTFKLSEICKTNQENFSKNDDWNFVNYLDTGNITANHIETIQKIFLKTEKLPSRAKRKVKTDSIIYSTVRPIQRHYGIIKSQPKNFLVSTGFVVIDVDKNFLDAKFLYYFLTLDDIVEKLQTLAEQSVSTYPSIKSSDLENLEINLPPLEIQKKIAAVLSALDDKIETNNAINKNLEQQAQAIFKSWFIDFEPFGGKMPDDWKIGKVIDIPMLITDYVANGSFSSLKQNVKLLKDKSYAYFIRNVDLKSGNFNVYVDEHSYNFLSKSKLYGGEIIISNVGDVGSVFLCPTLDIPMTLGNNVIMLRPDKNFFNYYLYIWFKYSKGKDMIQKITSGSAQPKFNKTDFRSSSILLPTYNVLNDYHKIVSPMFEKFLQNQQENKKLIEMRDLLLPRLLNGEIDVSAVEI